MSSLAFATFLTSSFGILSALRTIDYLHENRLIDRSLRSKLGIFAAISILLLEFLLSRHPLFSWIIVLVFVFSLGLSHLFVRRLRENSFKSDFLDYLERVILLVRTGRPFRLALTASKEDIDPFTKEKLEKILEYVFFSQQNELHDTDIFTRDVTRELIAIDRSTHKSLERLTAFRRNLRLDSEFREKAGQVLRRVRWQMFILSGLYVALLIFMFFNFRWNDLQTCVLMSVPFFVTGMIWILAAGRKVKWKI